MKIPLAEKLRPQHLTDFIGQQHILAKNKALNVAITSTNIHSMIFYGPSGVGKTTLARIIANTITSNFIELSAISSNVKDLREIITEAKNIININKQTIVFIDEIHHFNKSQQDILLSSIETGLITLIGATTENPSFALNNALLSRLSVYIFKQLSTDELEQILNKIIKLDDINKKIIIQASNGDARKLLNIVEQIQQQKPNNIKHFIGANLANFDKNGDIYYQQLSALHKSVRGSNPDAALYWFVRLNNAGCDTKIIARRLLAIASEDIGLADPRALSITLTAWDIYHRVGAKEGDRAVAQALIYCAIAPKSNAVYLALNAAKAAIKDDNYAVPKHLCNATTKLMQKQGYGKDYRYAHNEKDAIATGQTYFPHEIGEKQYYHPTNRGLEIKITEKLFKLRNKSD